jgi:uncharacterized protein
VSKNFKRECPVLLVIFKLIFNYIYSRLSKSQLHINVETLKPYHPKRIGLLGSVARNEENSESDIEILFSLHQPIVLFTLSKIHFELEEKLHKKVDLISENGLNKFIKEKVLNKVRYFYEN